MDEDLNSDPFEDKAQESSWDNSPIFMDEQPAIVPLDKGGVPGKTLTLILMIAGLAGCGLLAMIGFAFYRPAAPPIVGRFFPSAAPTQTATRTPSPTITPSPTPNLTAQAYEETAVHANADWMELESEDFETNDQGWYTGEDAGDLARIIYEMKDGKYIWDTTSNQGFVQRTRINPLSIDDFYFALDTAQPDLTTAADYGIIFREDSSGNYYYFSLNNQGSFELWLYYESEWKEIISETVSSTIRPGESNRIGMLAEAEHFIFFINNQYVAEAYDGTLDKGRVGMAAGIHDAGLNIIFEFDNIVLKVP